MSLGPAERQRFRRAFVEKAGRAFDAMFDDDQQEQLITMTQREDRVLEKGAELQQWLLARHLATDPTARPGKAEAVACPKCEGAGVRDKSDTKPVPRRITTRAGPQELARRKYRCPKCRRVFFPPGHEARPRP